MNQSLRRCSVLCVGFFLIGLGLPPMASRSAAASHLSLAPGSTAMYPPADGKPGVLLPEGTRITLQLYEDVSSRDQASGQVVQWGVYRDVKGAGTNGEQALLIAAGAFANGKVTFARRGGVFGRPGRIAVDVTTVDAVDGQRIPVYCKPLDVQGRDKRALAWCLGIGLSIVGVVLFSTLSSGGGFFLIAVLPMFLGLVISGKDVTLPSKSTLIEVVVQRDMIINA